jgi:ABC-2 type transport system permease protein
MTRQFIPPPVKAFRDALFGFDPGNAGVAELAFSLAWSHPVIITLLAAHAILVCTRVLAGEVERGTIDVLLALPVSRWRLFISESTAWLVSGTTLLGGLYLGSFIGAQFIPTEHRPDWSRLAMVLANLALVYAVISTSSMLAAVLTDRRARAVLTVIILTVSSVLITFLYTLDPSLEFTKKLRFLSVLDYYTPIKTLLSGQWPVRDMLWLAGASLTIWLAAGIVLSRRDVTTT